MNITKSKQWKILVQFKYRLKQHETVFAEFL